MSFETRQETIKNLLTCGICQKLCREFMTIDECCHTFCKKCITKKITEENLRNCPKCNVDLGGAPLQKIKPDYRWQNLRNNYIDIREKLIKHKFMKPRGEDGARKEALNQAPPVVAATLDVKGKGKEVDHGLDQAVPEPPPAVDRKGKGKLIESSYETMGPEFVPFVDPSPTRRKEKYISSLVGADGTSNQTTASSRGKRKYTRRKPLPPRRASLSNMEPIEVNKDHSPIPNNQNSSALPSTEQDQTAAPVRAKRKYTRRKPLPHQRASLSDVEPVKVDEDISSIPNNQNPSPLEPPLGQMVNSSQERGGEPVEEMNEVKTGETSGTESASAANGLRKSRKGRPRKEEKKGVAEDLNIPTQIVVDSSSVCGRNRQIWFRLVACEKHESSGLLAPMIPKYLRVRDVNMRTSFIKKYLVEKLGLESDDEVEISMQGQPIHPDMKLYQLMEMWKSASRRERKKIVAVGSSGKDFVMVFTYSLQLQSGTEPF